MISDAKGNLYGTTAFGYNGTVADRQLKAYEATNGDLKAVVDYKAQETAGDYLRPDG